MSTNRNKLTIEIKKKCPIVLNAVTSKTVTTNFADLIRSKMSSIMSEEGTVWQCNDCLYVSKYATNVREHVEAKHVAPIELYCQYCDKVCPNKKSLRNHIYTKHKVTN